MKVIKAVFVIMCITVFAVTAAFFGGCAPSSPMPVYWIGAEHNFGGDLIKVEDDRQNERFIYSCKAAKPQNYSNCFYFIFAIGAVASDINSDEFTYTDEAGELIVFDGQGYHYFYGDIVVFISYADASERIKEGIASGDYGIEIGSRLFVPYCNGTAD